MTITDPQGSYGWALAWLLNGYAVTRQAWRLDAAPVKVWFDAVRSALVFSVYGEPDRPYDPPIADQQARDWIVCGDSRQLRPFA